MGKGFKRIIYLLVCILTITSLTACKKSEKDSEDKDALVTNPDAYEIDVMEEYGKLLEVEMNRGNIALFLNEYIPSQSKKDASAMIIKLEEYLDDNNYNIYESYILLNRYKKYVSLEIKSYLNILLTEGTKTFTDENNLNISIEEALERAKTAEDHLIIFPDGKTKPQVLELYKTYLNILIVEGKESNILTKENSSILKEEIINLYRDEVKEVETKGISNIFDDYLRILERNALDVNSKEAVKFHKDLESIIEEEFSKKK